MIKPSYITGEMSNDFEEALRLGSQAGIRSVAVRSGIWGRTVTNIDEQDVQRMKALLSQYGLRVGLILSPIGKCNIEDAQQVVQHQKMLTRMIQLADAFDTRLIRAFPLRRPGYEEYEPSHLDEYLEHIVESLTPLVKQAEHEGVLLCFECVGSTLARTAQEIRRVVDALGGSPAVRVVWEIDVASRAGESPSAGYPFVRGLIEDVHIKPNGEGHMDPIDGSVDTYENALRMLQADGYAGFATIEHWGAAEETLQGIHELQEALQRIT